MTELKGYAMMQFSYMLLKTYGKGAYTERKTTTTGAFKTTYERPEPR